MDDMVLEWANWLTWLSLRAFPKNLTCAMFFDIAGVATNLWPANECDTL